MRAAPVSFLQLQLGQEVVYLLLAAFSLISLVLGFLLSEEVAERERLSAELTKVTQQRDEVRLELDEQRGQMSRQSEREARSLAAARSTISAQQRFIDDLSGQLDKAKQDIAALQVSVQQLTAEKAALLAQILDKPPIINLSEAQGYTFPSGDSQLSEDFRKRLSDAVIPKLLSEGQRYEAKVIEVIGHTDEVKVPDRYSNLDSRLVQFLNSESRDSALVAGDNTGLGMVRAAAVARFLMADQSLSGYIVLPLSAGQVIDVTGQLSRTQNERDVRERRRIEIRLRR